MSNEKAAPEWARGYLPMSAAENAAEVLMTDKLKMLADAISKREHAECNDCIATLTAEVAALKAEIARRDAPVTDAEWEWGVDRTWLGSREAFNALILARATPPQDGGKG